MTGLGSALGWRAARACVCFGPSERQLRHADILSMSWSARVNLPRPMEQMTFPLSDFKRRRSRRRLAYQNS